MDHHGFAHEILARTIAEIGAPWTTLIDRRDAAFMVAFVATLIEPTEAEVADLFTAAPRTFDDERSVEALARALGTLQGDRDRIGASVARLVRRAFDESRVVVLPPLVGRMLVVEPWRRHVDDAWCAAAMEWTLDEWPERECAAGTLARRALDAYPVVPEWLRAHVDMFPALVASRCLDSHHAVRLHVSAPSVAGWHYLSEAGHADDVVADPLLFGDALGEAVVSLEQALGEAKGSRCVALARFLVSLKGSAP